MTQTATTWDEGQKMDAIRKAYQRAVQIPMDNVKRMWEEYQEFENNLNKITVSVPPLPIDPRAHTLHFCVAGQEADIRSDACAYAGSYGLDHVARASHGTISSSASVKVQNTHMASPTTQFLRRGQGSCWPMAHILEVGRRQPARDRGERSGTASDSATRRVSQGPRPHALLLGDMVSRGWTYMPVAYELICCAGTWHTHGI